MSQRKTNLRAMNPQQKLSVAELASERAQLLELRRQPNVDKKLIDLALKSLAERMSTEEIYEDLGRERRVNQ